METITNLLKLQLPANLKNFVELYRNPTPDDFWAGNYEADQQWPKDTDGAGLLIYCYTGLRPWVKTSISKSPYSFLKKSLENQPETLTNVILVKGTPEYPLTEGEIKGLSGLLNNRLKNTPVAVFTSYITMPSVTENTQLMLDNTLNQICVALESFEYDLTVLEEEPKPETEPLRTFSETFETNGTKTIVHVKLADETAPENGTSYASVKLLDAEGNVILSAFTGKYPD